MDVQEEDQFKACYEICRHHHERYDGNGYPDGLKGNEIPISAQLVSIVDVYDALVSVRVYKKAFSRDDAFRMIVNGECGVFAPKLVQCFMAAKERIANCDDVNTTTS
jgi:putative two-component system response regulator